MCPHCCEELTNGSKTLQTALLGHVMAYELGHLLRGTGSHVASGLMHAPWHANEMQIIAFGGRLFTPEEAGRIRRQVAERLSGEGPVLTAGK
ncbi:MAG: hypothetical protein ABSC08_04995 [Bryobacteraceae bacterium]